MEERISLITVVVKDLGAMRRFYERVFGWEATSHSNEKIAFFHLNGMQLALFDRQAMADETDVEIPGTGFKGFVLAYNVQSREQVNSLFEELESKGAEVVEPPQETNWGGYSGYISDPEKNLWEIAYNPFMAFDEAGNVLQAG